MSVTVHIVDKDKREGYKEEELLLKEWLGLEVGETEIEWEKIFKRKVNIIGCDLMLFEGFWSYYHFEDMSWSLFK